MNDTTQEKESIAIEYAELLGDMAKALAEVKKVRDHVHAHGPMDSKKFNEFIAHHTELFNEHQRRMQALDARVSDLIGGSKTC